ncbi:hypothetical protein BaRGS_00013420, partial [Batillaria attramentaria]
PERRVIKPCCGLAQCLLAPRDVHHVLLALSDVHHVLLALSDVVDVDWKRRSVCRESGPGHQLPLINRYSVIIAKREVLDFLEQHWLRAALQQNMICVSWQAEGCVPRIAMWKPGNVQRDIDVAD